MISETCDACLKPICPSDLGDVLINYQVDGINRICESCSHKASVGVIDYYGIKPDWRKDLVKSNLLKLRSKAKKEIREPSLFSVIAQHYRNKRNRR